MNWETIMSFGDSITFGARSYLGYPEICGHLLEKFLHKDWHVINHASNGFTAIDLVRSITPQIANYQSYYPSVITVMIGTNDIKTNVSAENFQIAYKQLLVKLKLISVGNNIILLKLPRFTQKVFYPYTFSMNEKVTLFNDIIETLAKENEVRTFEFHFEDKDFYDGVHLNEKGSLSAAIQLSEFILKDKGIEGTSAMS